MAKRKVTKECHRFAGVCLGGGKTDKTAVVVVEYYPSYQKVFVRKIYSRVGPVDELSADFVLHDILTKQETDLELIGFDAPLSLPPFFKPKFAATLFEKSKDPEVKWLFKSYEKRNHEKRPDRYPTPYTERPIDFHIQNHLEEAFHISHALGANAAPLAARAMYLNRLIKIKSIEVFPKLSIWRIGLGLKIQKSYLKFHRHPVDSEEARQYILRKMMDEKLLFIYQQDLKHLVEEPDCFDALFVALTAYLKFSGQCEKPPKDFPKGAAWIEFPRLDYHWQK